MHGFADGYRGLWPRDRDPHYLREHARGRDARLAEHRTFSDAAVVSPRMIAANGCRVVGGGITTNQSVGSVT